MLYPRTVKLNNKEVLVNEAQCVGYKEHMADRHRILFLSGIIAGDMENHNLFLTLDSLSHDPIKLIITSPGGDLDSTFLFYDTMRLIKSPIVTVGRYCASGAALLLAAGTKRYLFPHAKVMLHLPAGHMGGDARDWEIQHREMQKYKHRMVDILCDCGVKKSREEILIDIDRDYWLEPKEAIAYGLVDGIMTPEIWQSWLKEGKRP